MTERKGEKLLPGFPRKGKFQTKEEVDAYFASDKIQCLLCGKWFKCIAGMHLKLKHGITMEDYREMFGLPWKRGLTGRASHKTISAAAKRRFLKRDLNEMLENMRSVKTSPPRASQPFARDYIKRLAQSRKARYQPEDFEAVLERMRVQERTAYDVCGDPDMPSESTFRIYLENHPEFKEKHRKVHYELPYPVQVASHDLSPQIYIDCKDLRARGMSLKKIAKSMGISRTRIKRILYNGPGGYPDRKAFSGRREEDYEAILDRMRDQQRRLRDVCNDLDLPSYKMWVTFKKKHPEFEEKYWRVIDSFPYPVQIRFGIHSPGLIAVCRRMRSRGKTFKEIGDELGVSMNSAWNLLRKIEKKENNSPAAPADFKKANNDR